MDTNQQYINQLEQLISSTLLPIYSKYFELIDQPEPEINELKKFKSKKQIPALLKKKT